MTGQALPEANDDRVTGIQKTMSVDRVPSNPLDRTHILTTPSGRVGTPLETQFDAAVGISNKDEPEEDHADHTGRRCILTDKCWIKHIWNFIVALLLAYTATVFLYLFAFVEFHIGTAIEKGMFLMILDRSVDGLFWLDLVLNFFLSYQDDKGNEVESLKLIAMRYLRFDFWINLMACIPAEAYGGLITFALSDEGSSSNVHKAVRMYRLQRASRLARFMRIMRLAKFEQLMSRSTFVQWIQHLRGVRIASFLCGLFLAVHVLACGWYVIAALHEDVEETWVFRRGIVDNAPFAQWSCAMYWVLMVFTTVGFGDIIAITELEMAYCAVTMLVGAVIHSILISEVIGIITTTNEVKDFTDKQVHLVEAFSAHAGLDPATARTMKLEVKWRAKRSAINPHFDKKGVEDLLTGKYMPRWLIARIPQKLFGGKLLRNGFLQVGKAGVVPPRLPCLLAMHVLVSDFLAGDIIYQVHDFPFNVFLVLSGTFACVGLPGHRGGVDTAQPDLFEMQVGSLYPYMLFSAGAYFGDSDLISACARRSTCRCERNGSTLTLHKKDYMELQEMFPDFALLWKFAAIRREGVRKRSLARLTRGLPLKHLAAAQIQRGFRGSRSPHGESQASGQVAKDLSGASIGSNPKGQQDQGSTARLQAQVDSLQKDFSDFKDEMITRMDELRALLQGTRSV